MAYNKEDFRRISESFAVRRQAAEDAADIREAEISAKYPEIAKIDRTLAATGLRVLKAASDGGDIEKQIKALRSETEKLTARRAEILREAGLPADYTEPKYTCPLCRDEGYLPDGRMCVCMRRELSLAGYKNSGIGKLIETQSFESFSLDYYKSDDNIYALMKKNFDAMREYAATFKPETSGNLLLLGETGLGKTHLSTAVAKAVIDRGYEVRYDSVQNIVSVFEREKFGRETRVSGEEYLSVDLLIIDDLGTELTTALTVSIIYNIINTRINRALPTIINTNLGAAELRERYSDRITSRLLGEFSPVVFRGDDIRMQKLR